MRFVLASIFFVITAFIFFVYWAVMSFYVNIVHDALEPYARDLGSSSLNDIFAIIPLALGLICLFIFVVLIVLGFIMESLSDEPELYFKER